MANPNRKANSNPDKIARITANLAKRKTVVTATSSAAVAVKDDDNLAIPPFLVRKDVKRLTNEEAANLASVRQRDWAPIRSKDEVTKRESLASIMTKVDAATVDKALPVSVQAVVKGKHGIGGCHQVRQLGGLRKGP